MRLFEREDYLEKIRGLYHDDGVIKVLTGVRRCGKSCLMQTIAEELRATGVREDHIIYLDLDRYGFRSVKTPDQLEALIEPALKIDGIKYLFIDEIQNVEEFEEVVNEFRVEGGFSIFITGSNSYLLSGELATKLTGRYIEFEVQTLSFKEYREMKRFLGQAVGPNPVAELDRYILEGGFPKALDYPRMADKRAYVGSVIKEIFEKDIRRRVKVKNVSVFNQVRDYVINNFGATTSLTNIQSDLERQGVRIKRETLNRYLQILEDAKIISKCARFDMKSRKSLKGEQKYYLADLSFYFALNTDNHISYGPVLENIVYCYTKSMGYEVSVGRIGKLECDFVMRSPEMEYAYVQVAMAIMGDRSTEDREYRPLEQIRDNWPKFVITRSDPIQRRGGIVHENVTELIGEGRTFGLARRALRRGQTTRKFLLPASLYSYPLHSLRGTACHEAELRFSILMIVRLFADCLYSPLSTRTYSYLLGPRGRVGKGLWMSQEKCGRRRSRPRPLKCPLAFHIKAVISRWRARSDYGSHQVVVGRELM